MALENIQINDEEDSLEFVQDQLSVPMVVQGHEVYVCHAWENLFRIHESII